MKDPDNFLIPLIFILLLIISILGGILISIFQHPEILLTFK